MDSFFSKGFKSAKCKTLLKLTIPRIKLLRNRREVQLKQMRREIAKLLETGQEATARIRVEHIIREEKMMAAQEIVELFCELIAVRLPIIEAQRECPLDLKEAISSVCFAAPRCADLPELLQVQMLFAGKYGREFVAAATELLPECGVNRQLVELLSVRAPSPDVKLKLLKEIAEEHELDWDPTASENELLKKHEDLLNGSTQFLSGSNLPHVEDKKNMVDSSLNKEDDLNSDPDADYDILDFPEVPAQPLQPSKGNVSTPEMLPFPAGALSDVDQEDPTTGSNRSPSQLESKEILHEKPVTREGELPHTSASTVEVKQYVPFISPPSQQSASPPVRQDSPPLISKMKIVTNVDLQDVLAAAQAAAESAERAAAAARSAASLAQLRISELSKKNCDEVSDVIRTENPFHASEPRSDALVKGGLGHQDSFGISDGVPTPPSSHEQHHPQHEQTSPPPHNVTRVEVDSPYSNPVTSQAPNHHQPQRLPSMDDEPYFSYPNLFTSQGSNTSSPAGSFKDNSKPTA